MAVYALGEVAGKPIADRLGCLGGMDASAEVVGTGNEVRARCGAGLAAVDATFEGLAHVEALQVPQTVEAGQTAEAKVLWEPLVRHPQPHQLWLHLEDGETQLGNATLDPFPATQWQPGEAVLSWLMLRTDPTALPDSYAGPGGITWLHRWALTQGKRGSIFAGEPEVPDWIQKASQ